MSQDISTKPCPPKLTPPTSAPPPCKKEETGESEKPEESKEKPEEPKNHYKEIWHPGFDARFPNMNQTRRCWQNYVDFYRCQEKFGEDHEPCEYFKKTFTYLCPGFWVEQWDEQRENGSFPQYPYKNCDDC